MSGFTSGLLLRVLALDAKSYTINIFGNYLNHLKTQLYYFTTMVFIQVKKSDTEQIFVECKTTETNDAVIDRIVELWNTRLRLGRLCASALGLADYGPEKRENEQFSR